MFAVTAFVGCDDSGSTKPPAGEFDDSRLVGTWELKYGDDVITTVIITSDGKFSMTGTQSVEIKIETKGSNEIWADGVKRYDYIISSDGNILTLDGVEYTKKTGNGGDGGDNGASLVLGANQAWTDEFEWPGEAEGYIFNADGTYQAISNYCGVWEVDWEDTYTVSGNTLNVTNGGMGMPSSVQFSITGNTLIIDADEFRITNNVTVVTEGGCDDNEEFSSPLSKSRISAKKKLKTFNE